MSVKTIISKSTIYISGYVIMCAISHVSINHTARSIDPIVLLFYTSLFTIIFFSLLNLRELTKNITIIKDNIKSILWLNLLNAIIWFVTFFSLKFLSPAVFACLFLGAIPIHIFLLELKKSKATRKSNSITAILLCIMFILMLALVFQDLDTTNSYKTFKYGALVVFVGGSVAAFIMKISKQLAVKNVSASLVVSLRFYGLLIISFVLLMQNSTQFLVSSNVLIEFLALALISMALPLFLLQKALKTTSPLFTSIIITIIPVLTYFLQVITGYYSFSIVKLVITILFSLSLILLAYLKKRKQII